MKLRWLLRNIEKITVRGSKEVEITGITAHSHSVAPGNLFVAKKGKKHDGTRFIPEAAKAGAAAILTDVYDPFISVTQLITDDVPALESHLAGVYYGNPSEELRLIGVTGTNGKTTCALLLRYLLEKWEEGLVGLMSTVSWETGKSRLPAAYTTADQVTNQKLLREMVLAGCHSAVLEVSSHGLEQKRVEKLAFDLALFTNLTREHLDYHQTMECYGLIKRSLFEKLPPGGFAILNADDPFTSEIKRVCKAQIMTYGIGEADVRGGQLKCGMKGVEFMVEYRGKEVPFKSPLIGTFNISNLLGVTAAALALGIPFEKIAEWLKTPPNIPGRMTRVKNSLGINIFVDYAHTPDALKNALVTLKEMAKGKVVVVFGCGGERDQGKRAEMGSIAEKYSDLMIMTNDNPRHEDPWAILADILAGCRLKHLVQPDRRKAIQEAIEASEPGDLLLIAGKGHESVQIDANGIRSFDDAQVTAEICRLIERQCRAISK